MNGHDDPKTGAEVTTWRTIERDLAPRVGGPEARWLIERASGYDAAELSRAGHEVPLHRQVGFLDAMVERRLAGEPLQYVLGRWPFRSLELIVDRRVLIPRPETEVVAGIAIDHLRAFDRSSGPFTVVDLGTGSGAIGLSIATEVVSTEVWCTDASADALDVARANLAGIGRAATRVRLEHGSWFAALPAELQGRVALVVSNPPYVGVNDDVDEAVRVWEPPGALFAGPDGTDDLRQILYEACAWLRPGGLVVMELAPAQAEPMAALARTLGYCDVAVHPDLTRRPRAIVARTP